MGSCKVCNSTFLFEINSKIRSGVKASDIAQWCKSKEFLVSVLALNRHKDHLDDDCAIDVLPEKPFSKQIKLKVESALEIKNYAHVAETDENFIDTVVAERRRTHFLLHAINEKLLRIIDRDLEACLNGDSESPSPFPEAAFRALHPLQQCINTLPYYREAHTLKDALELHDNAEQYGRVLAITILPILRASSTVKYVEWDRLKEFVVEGHYETIMERIGFLVETSEVDVRDYSIRPHLDVDIVEKAIKTIYVKACTENVYTKGELIEDDLCKVIQSFLNTIDDSELAYKKLKSVANALLKKKLSEVKIDDVAQFFSL